MAGATVSELRQGNAAGCAAPQHQLIESFFIFR